MPRASPPPARLSTRDRLIVFAVWISLGLLETAKGYLNARLVGAPQGWIQPLIDNMPWWLAWAALTPVVIALGRRVRLDDGPRAVALHAGASVLIALAHHLVVGTLYYYTHTRGMQMMLAGEPRTITLSLQLWNFFFSFFVLNVVTYWAPWARTTPSSSTGAPWRETFARSGSRQTCTRRGWTHSGPSSTRTFCSTR